MALTAAQRIAELDAARAVFSGTDNGRAVNVLGVTFVADASQPNGYRARIEAAVTTGTGATVEQLGVEVPTPAGWKAALDTLFTNARAAWKSERGVP